MSKRAKLEAFRKRVASKVNPDIILDEVAKEIILVAYYMPQYFCFFSTQNVVTLKKNNFFQ